MAKSRSQAGRKSKAPSRQRPSARGSSNAPATSRPSSSAVSGTRYNGIGADAVERATGRGWAEWLAALDRAGAKTLPHAEIAELLTTKFGVGPWWSQMVTVGYEQARGLRVKHETARGFSISASRTLNIPVDELFRAFTDTRRRVAWLGKPSFTVRKAAKNKSLRITWPDATNVEVNFYAKGDAKSQVAVQHDKLTSNTAAARMKKYWNEKLDALRDSTA